MGALSRYVIASSCLTSGLHWLFSHDGRLAAWQYGPRLRCDFTGRHGKNNLLAGASVGWLRQMPRQRVRARQAEQSFWTTALEDCETIDPADGHVHECTIIYLHGCCCSASEYLEDGYCMPWLPGGDRLPGLRAVLPDSGNLQQPWGETVKSWHLYHNYRDNRVGGTESLEAIRKRLAMIVYAEVERLGGAGHRVFLGGASQGCTVALDVYLREARKLRLGGFVGSVGFMPNDLQGYTDSTRNLERLIADKEMNQRPIWIQCATDDHEHVPWRTCVKPSLRRAMGRLPGLKIREVSGRGHILDEWEGHVINDFLKEAAARSS